jgi:hypothetical protein
VTYQIVGDDEADIKQNLISISSPIARALIGKPAWRVDADLPGGKCAGCGVDFEAKALKGCRLG